MWCATCTRGLNPSSRRPSGVPPILCRRSTRRALAWLALVRGEVYAALVGVGVAVGGVRSEVGAVVSVAEVGAVVSVAEVGAVVSVADCGTHSHIVGGAARLCRLSSFS